MTQAYPLAREFHGIHFSLIAPPDSGQARFTFTGRRVVLDIPRIDEPAILRTIIMIRNYKRLYPGRHEFGEPRTFPPR